MTYTVKRKRNRRCKGWTRRFTMGEEKLYITLNVDDGGELFEIFIRQGKAGTMENCYCEAVARLASLALRCNADPQDIARQLRGLSGPRPIWEAAEKEGERATLLLSTPHCVAIAIDEWLNKVYQKERENK